MLTRALRCHTLVSVVAHICLSVFGFNDMLSKLSDYRKILLAHMSASLRPIGFLAWCCTPFIVLSAASILLEICFLLFVRTGAHML